MMTDSFDTISVMLISAVVLSLNQKIRRIVYPTLICILGSIALYHLLPVWAVQHYFVNQPNIVKTLIIGIPLFMLLYGIKVWTFLPMQANCSLPFFSILCAGWIFIRCVFWLFIYIQGTLNSPSFSDGWTGYGNNKSRSMEF
jgi:hypothetical protein